MAEKYGVDDVSFTLDVVEELKLNLCVDENRLFASGKSNVRMHLYDHSLHTYQFVTGRRLCKYASSSYNL